METNLEDKSLDDIAHEILVGLGVPCTDAHHFYLFHKLAEIVDCLTKLNEEEKNKSTET